MEGDMLSIRPFSSFEEAKRYAHSLETDSLFRTDLPIRVLPIVISEDNLILLQRGATMEQYHAFLPTAILSTAMENNPGLANLLSGDPVISPEKEPQEEEKIVPLKAGPIATAESRDRHPTHQTDTLYHPITPDKLKRQLEEKEARALRQSERTVTSTSRKQLLRERERERQERIRQKQRELKERQREREARLKQRERERHQQIRKRD